MKKLLSMIIASVLCGQAFSANYPSKTIEFVTHSGAGGGTDLTATYLDNLFY